MNKKKGFTLIELLAIIVILAIIAVITVPLILNIINDAQKNASIDSAYGYKSALEKYYMKKVVENTENELPNGYKNVSELPEDFVVSGDAPSEGWVKLKKGIVEKFSLKYNEYVVTMDNDKNVTSEKKNNIDSRVPDEYQEIEYLESTGTQYIDTGVIGESTWKITNQYITPSVASQILVGCGSSGGQWFGQNTNEYAIGNNSTYIYNIDSATKQDILIDFSTTGVTSTIEGEIKHRPGGLTNNNYYLLGGLTSGSTNFSSYTRVYSAKVYQINTIVRNLVPVIRKSDNKPGMLDLANLSKNLFDKDNANVVNRYVTSEQKIATSSNARSIIIPCQPNTTYTFSKIQSTRFNLGYTTAEIETGTDVYNNIIDNNATYLTITTGANAKYLVVYVYNSVYDTNTTLEQILDSVQLEFGTIATPYESYKKSFYTNDGTGEFIAGPEI